MYLRLNKIAFSLFLLISCKNNTESPDKEGSKDVTKNTTPFINYGVSGTFSHDTTSFTEGLLVHDGKLYESTGSPNDMPQTKSLLGEVDLKTGKINPKVVLDRQKYFGEGIVFLKDKVYQLTYQSRVGFVYDAKTFKKLREFSFNSKEGWGMTTDGTYLIMSDGTNSITYSDPSTFKAIKSVNVTDENGAVMNVNELEFINGFIYANIYTTNYIIKIDPGTGQVTGKLDLTSLVNEAKLIYPASLELNGIAYDSATGQVYVTGKMWPRIYQIVFNHQ